MIAIRIHQYQVPQAEDGSYSDTWRWASAEEMLVATKDAPSIPAALAAMSLMREHSARSGEIIHES